MAETGCVTRSSANLPRPPWKRKATVLTRSLCSRSFHPATEAEGSLSGPCHVPVTERQEEACRHIPKPQETRIHTLKAKRNSVSDPRAAKGTRGRPLGVTGKEAPWQSCRVARLASKTNTLTSKTARKLVRRWFREPLGCAGGQREGTVVPAHLGNCPQHDAPRDRRKSVALSSPRPPAYLCVLAPSLLRPCLSSSSSEPRPTQSAMRKPRPVQTPRVGPGSHGGPPTPGGTTWSMLFYLSGAGKQ